MFRPVIIIPCFNHTDVFENFAPKIASLGFPVMVVDDGSMRVQSQRLKNICSGYNFTYLHRFPNAGKGCAVRKGFFAARSMGFTHALQIDADGQHDCADVTKFFALAQQNPESLIVGNPVYDHSAPRARRIGRKITNFWVAIETLNFGMPDAMCGMRVYPLNETCRAARYLVFKRMGFDIEILVKLYWRGLKIIAQPTRVIYPIGGVSNFRILRDNFYISLLHTYLCAMMPIGICQRIVNYGKRN